MKKLTLISFLCVLMTACQDTIPTYENTATITSPTKQPGMQRVVVSSSSEIESLIASMGDDYNSSSRTLLSPSLSNSEDEFVSLIEADRIKVMSSLTPEQLDSIYNDEDELEYYPTDSVIADFRFAQLLNANREIEVDIIVYRYYPNGVAFAPSIYVEDLQNIDSLVAQVEVNDETLGNTTENGLRHVLPKIRIDVSLLS